MARQTLPTSIETSGVEGVNMLRSFSLHLRGLNLSPLSVETYLESTSQFLAWLKDRGMPTASNSIKREHIESFIVYLLEDRGLKSGTANRHRGIQALFKWLVQEGDVTRSPMERMKPAKVTDNPPVVLKEDDLARLLATCYKGNDFVGRLDAALLRVFIDTGACLAELVGLTVEDVDLDTGVIHVLGKGRRPRILSIGKRTARALGRYLRLRTSYRAANLESLWLGRGGGITDPLRPG